MGATRPHFVQQQREKHPHKRVEVWFQDEVRVGQQGRLTQVWAPMGSRSRMVKQTEYKWRYVFGAVNPLTGASSAIVAPRVDTGLMNAFLKVMSDELDDDVHAVLRLDNAGWQSQRTW